MDKSNVTTRGMFVASFLGALIGSGFGASPFHVARGAETLVTVEPASIAAGLAPLTLNFPVSRSKDLSYEAIVGYHTVDGTAVAGVDYTGVVGTLSIPAGSRSAVIPVTVSASTENGPEKTFSLVLDRATGVGSEPEFSAPQSFAAGDRLYSITVADLDGNGKPDVLVPNLLDNTVTILLNTSSTGATNPSFAPVITLPTGSYPAFIAVADLNGDGMPDVIVANGKDSNVSIFLNTGATESTAVTFADAQTFPTGSVGVSLVATDLNGDGKPDLVVADSGDNTISILVNTTIYGSGSATFSVQQVEPVGFGPVSVVAPDLNGDGIPDIVVANNIGNTISVLMNLTLPGDAEISFAPSQTFDTGPQPNSITSADLNGDGRPDIVVANTSTTDVLINSTAPGSPVASFNRQPALPAMVDSYFAAIVDLNGDGKPDLAIADINSEFVEVLINTTIPGAEAGSFRLAELVDSGVPVAVAAADFNGDGLPDLIAANKNSSSVSVMVHAPLSVTTNLDFLSQQTFQSGYSATIKAADLNGDGRPDVITLNSQIFGSNVAVNINATLPGADTPVFLSQQIFATEQFPLSLAVGDLNGDGKPDLVVGNFSSNSVSVLRNTTETGAMSAAFADQQLLTTGAAPRSVILDDIDSDGRLDVVVANQQDDTVSVFLNTTAPGDDTFSFTPRRDFSAPAPIFLASGDLNGDGRPDLVTSSFNDNAPSYLVNATVAGSGVAGFAPAEVFPNPPTSEAVAIADVNGDGLPDVIFQVGEIAVYVNTTLLGGATLSFAPVQEFGAYPRELGSQLGSFLAVGDVNGDGKPDAVVETDFVNGNASVFLNATSPGSTVVSFIPQVPVAIGAKPQAAVLADINGDGVPDLLVTNSGPFTVSVLVNAQYEVAASGSPAPGTIVFDHVFADGFD